jgi:hypothetical protein
MRSSGCGLLLLIIIAVAGLVITKPPESAHRRAIAERTPVARAIFGVMEALGNAELEYHDYWVISVMTAKFESTGPEMPISYGVLGKVYYARDD